MTHGAALRPRRRLLLLTLVFVAAAALVLTDNYKAPDLAPAVARAPVVAVRSNDAQLAGPLAPAMIGALELRVAATDVRDLFAARTWRKPVHAPMPVAQVSPVSQPPAVPQAPTLPYTFLGKQLLNGSWNVFLGLQDRTLIVKEDDVVDGTWRVSAIRPPSMGMLHLPTGLPRVLPIGEGK